MTDRALPPGVRETPAAGRTPAKVPVWLTTRPLDQRKRMSAVNRSTLLKKLQRVLKKQYQPYKPNPDRSVLEHLLFAACVEDSHVERAEEAYAAVMDAFFDFNEIRVTTIGELAEVLRMLPDPAAAAWRLRRTLQSVFEANYSFDVENLRKQNLGKAIKLLENYVGVTPFMVSYVTQVALDGHAIPVDGGIVGVMVVLGLVNEKQAKTFKVPGLDRAVSKSKGLEFASLLHQLGADFIQNRYAPNLHKLLLDVDPDARDRLPKRSRKKAEPKKAEPKKAKAIPPRKKASSAAKLKDRKSAGKAAVKKKSPVRRLARKKPR